MDYLLQKLFAKITKYGWFDILSKENGSTVYSFREIIQDVSKFLQVRTVSGTSIW